MTKVIIAGSRSITDIEQIKAATYYADVVISEVVSGCAHGVDQLGEDWAALYNVPVKQFPADWEKHGKSAGFVRNSLMADYADYLIAVWDGKSKGTLHMINQMALRNKPIFVYCPR